MFSEMNGPVPEFHTEQRISISAPLVPPIAPGKHQPFPTDNSARKSLQHGPDLSGALQASINIFVSQNVTQIILLNWWLLHSYKFGRITKQNWKKAVMHYFHKKIFKSLSTIIYLKFNRSLIPLVLGYSSLNGCHLNVQTCRTRRVWRPCLSFSQTAPLGTSSAKQVSHLNWQKCCS